MVFTSETLKTVLKRTEFLDKHAGTLSSKWAKITKSSQDTAGRDIQDLMAKGILKKEVQEGRSTSYELVW